MRNKRKCRIVFAPSFWFRILLCASSSPELDSRESCVPEHASDQFGTAYIILVSFHLITYGRRGIFYVWIFAAVSNGKRKTEAKAIFLNPCTACSSCKRKFVVCLFVYEEANRSYPFANGLNGLSYLLGPLWRIHISCTYCISAILFGSFYLVHIFTSRLIWY